MHLLRATLLGNVGAKAIVRAQVALCRCIWRFLVFFSPNHLISVWFEISSLKKGKLKEDNVSFQNVTFHSDLSRAVVMRSWHPVFFMFLNWLIPQCVELSFIVDLNKKNRRVFADAFCWYTGQNQICPSSATVASLKISPGKLKSKNVDSSDQL